MNIFLACFLSSYFINIHSYQLVNVHININMYMFEFNTQAPDCLGVPPAVYSLRVLLYTTDSYPDSIYCKLRGIIRTLVMQCETPFLATGTNPAKEKLKV